MATENRTTAEEARNAFISAAMRWANHMNHWERFKFHTGNGTIFVSIARADPYPDSLEEFSNDR
jgi:hypothetical protein